MVKLAVSGTYSSGKTLTVMALSHLTGLPRTMAMTMREILPLAVPGKTLDQCTAAEFLQLVVRRHVERCVHESLLPGGFVSDGSSLQEWIYAKLRVSMGISPRDSAHLRYGESVPKTDELRFFDDVVEQLGVAVKQHVGSGYDVFVHLRNELPVLDDGHRPMNDNFRRKCDELMLGTFRELGVEYEIVGGSLPDRLLRIVEVVGLPMLLTPDEAISRARNDYARQDLRLETQR
ncbi:AAA family ATPase [Actinocrispum wychmicini]|uniref:AAA domain-containing protein n=1 Tax=Actinocrispum wychmicini TaxID=1213861 RepID=A0A4R2JQ17_9PSEU|nr:AAA family ATPase [Actinocrispum wychmicini]TCO62293.1 AAA domain-containing protein [Actinocrispum wychmicini]